jgi:chemotaxis family two-component system sensor kinase Cph1
VTEPDLLGCADEPIRTPGAVQPHGALLAVTEPDLTVVVASENAPDLLGRDVAGRPLTDLLPADLVAALQSYDLEPQHAVLDGRAFDVVAHRTGGLLVTEWEPLDDAHDAGAAWHRRLPRVLSRLQETDHLGALCDVLAQEVRDLTGFDRVMVYRFDEQWNGTVVAEQRREDLEPFLGLRYPASDIPAQARALYLRSWLRLIPDARYVPARLVPDRNPLDGRPLDLGDAVLRSVSPVHLEYLANLGVVASMSVSLVDDGRLWGLIACHSYRGPHRPSPADRVAAEFLGRTASLLLGTKVDAGQAQAVLEVAERSARLVEALGRSPRQPAQALVEERPSVLELVPAGGAAVRLDGQLHLLGDTPQEDAVRALLDALPTDGPTVTDAVLQVVPDGAHLVPTASGVLAVPVPGGGALAWFRPEVLREVTWAGDPRSKELVDDELGPRLSPRRSFAAWVQEVRATSSPWLAHEVRAAEQLARHLADVAARRGSEESRLAATLQRTLLLEQLPDVPGVALAARYSPSAADVVGGDWYDLVLLPNGRVSVVLGDVAGHGLGAAAITAQLRHALRAYLLQSAGPAAALRRLNELAAYLLPEELATVVVAELDPATGTVLVANAGHLPVLLLGPDGPELVDAARGPALGMVTEAAYGQAELRLAADDRLVVFSDGLVELRGPDLDERLSDLRRLAAAAPRDPEALLDALLAGLAPPGSDDVTLLALGPR